MTANELADAIEKGGKDGFFQDVIISILRQQQAEIERLGSELNRSVELYTDKAIENEALHKLVKEQDMKIINLSFDVAYANRTDEFRELTDEEIESAFWSLVGKQHEGKIASYLYNFARDILNKASEK